MLKALVCVTLAATCFSAAALAQQLTPVQEAKLVQKTLTKGADIYFNGCDGYGAPSPQGDGMTVMAAFKVPLGLGPGAGFVSGVPDLAAGGSDTLRRTPKFSVEGIADCGAALSDLEAMPAFWMRKVSLLRARALHRLVSGDTIGAKTDLISAESSVPTYADQFYNRSLKIAIELERAYLLSRTGSQNDAESLAMAAWVARPYSREVIYSAIIAMGPSADNSKLNKLRQALETLDPGQAGPPMFKLPMIQADAIPPSTPIASYSAEGLYDLLPEPETEQRLAPASDPSSIPSDDHAQLSRPDGPAVLTARFYGRYATLSISEERSLLQAANRVKEAGFHGLIITTRADYWHVLTRDQSRCYQHEFGHDFRVPCSPDMNWTGGFETVLNFVPADPTSPPRGYEADTNRILNADDIIAVLGPVYASVSK